MTTELEMHLALQIRQAKLPEPLHQYRFHPTRMWRFDLAWPDRKLAVEADGGQWVRGRHQRPLGFAKDAEKLNEAALMGWTVLRFATSQVRDNTAIQTITRALNAHP